MSYQNSDLHLVFSTFWPCLSTFEQNLIGTIKFVSYELDPITPYFKIYIFLEFSIAIELDREEIWKFFKPSLLFSFPVFSPILFLFEFAFSHKI